MDSPLVGNVPQAITAPKAPTSTRLVMWALILSFPSHHLQATAQVVHRDSTTHGKVNLVAMRVLLAPTVRLKELFLLRTTAALGGRNPWIFLNDDLLIF